MSVYNYKKYKVSIDSESKKTQGLQVGDIVRRQYQDGDVIIYSLMCVLAIGSDKIVSGDTIKQSKYFIGALLEGDAPKSDELLDFVRISNLFNTDRSGALYLTASDSDAPFMDVIDRGNENSLCWPTSLASDDYIDSSKQYAVVGKEFANARYIVSDNDINRICSIRKNAEPYTGAIGIKQNFYEYIENPDRVIISYKIKSNRDLYNITATLGYGDGSRIDGEAQVSSSDKWQYKLHAITVDWSGRHLRAFSLNINDELQEGDEVCIADLNIVLQSSIGAFSDFSQVRIGKLDGVTDKVFGRLKGYGGYLQKLYASKSVNISGTLTAGDENGFASTFYAGKIHKNAFVSSTNINFIGNVDKDVDIQNPTGIGNVYKSTSSVASIAQTRAWLNEHIGKKYCFSFWLYSRNTCTLSVVQNENIAGTVYVDEKQLNQWIRHCVTFDLMAIQTESVGMIMSLYPIFNAIEEGSDNENLFYFTAPQLEQGDSPTQYQPTDETLNYTDDYGAWFSRGGIGGTIQNPLLQLNYDGEGSIGTRAKSLLLKANGSGYLANQNIKWDETGQVEFGENVKLNWNNLSEDAQKELSGKSIKISGKDTFTLAGYGSSDIIATPTKIELSVIEENLPSTAGNRKWYFLANNEYFEFENGDGDTLIVEPFANYWDNAINQLNIKCVVTINQREYFDTITIKRQHMVGYTLDIVSEKGKNFRNGKCSTTLTANVYYQGIWLTPEYVHSKLLFHWEKYTLPDTENEVDGWWNEVRDENGDIVSPGIDRSQPSIQLNYEINGSDLYVCKLIERKGFAYDFPVIF